MSQRVALALHIVELAENVDQIPSVIANIRQSFIHWRYASRALAQVLDEKHPEPPSPLLEAIKEISTLKTELSQTADKHALEISQKELEIHHLRAQLALASGPSTERLAKKKGKQKEVDGPVISASPSRQQAPAPPVPGKPKTKKSKARDAAVRDLEETLKANHSSEAKDLSHGYAIVDALQSLRGVLSSKLAKGNSTSETKQLFINRLSLLDRGASRLLTAVQGVLNLCVENNTYDGKSGQSSTSLAENSGEIIPVLIDVLNWLMSSVVEHVTSSNKTAAQQLKGNAKDAVLGAGESVQASVATEVNLFRNAVQTLSLIV